MVRKACKKRIQNKRLPEERYCSEQNALSPLVSFVEIKQINEINETTLQSIPIFFFLTRGF